MAEINHRAFLDMLAWSEWELITTSENFVPHGYDVIVGGELFTDPITPRKLVTLNPKLKSTGRTLPASFLLRDVYRKQRYSVWLSVQCPVVVAFVLLPDRCAFYFRIDRGVCLSRRSYLWAVFRVSCRAVFVVVRACWLGAWCAVSRCSGAASVRVCCLYHRVLSRPF